MNLPENVMKLLNDRDVSKSLITTAGDGSTSLINLIAVRAPMPNVIVLAQIAAKQLNDKLLLDMKAGSLVSILCSSIHEEGRVAYQIVCNISELQTSGPLYEKFLDELRARSVDLDGVWVLEPVDVIDRSGNFGIKTTTA